VHHLPEYRAYIIGRDGHIRSFESLVCTDDDTAIATAERLVDGHDVELWQADRTAMTARRWTTKGMMFQTLPPLTRRRWLPLVSFWRTP